MDENERVAEFIRTITWDALPGEVRDKAKICLLDALGAIIAGNAAAVTTIAARSAPRLWPGGDEARIFLTDQRSTAAGAAFVNACAANALDVDDDGKYTEGHPGAQIIPVTLAMAEAKGLSGKEALTALVIGYEVAHRTGRCWHDDHSNYQACGSWGSVANAAIAARALDLDELATLHALGIADYFAPNLPMMRDIDHPTMVKHGIGWGAMTGIMAAQLAAEGFTGIPSILGFEKYREWVADIGQKYIMVEGVTFKRFASCLWGHPALQAAMKLMAAYPIELTQIARIKVFGFHEMVRLGVAIPETEEQAQFSVAWPLAALLAEGELGPQQMLKKRYGDPTITDLVHRIELVETDEMNRLHTSCRYPSIVEIFLKDGNRYTSDMEFYYNSDHSGGADNFGDIWKPAEVREKFRWVCAGAVKAKVIDACLELIDHFEELPDVMTLTDLLSSEARI